MTIENVNNQLKITYDSGAIEYYQFSDIKSVSPYHAHNGEAYVVINFINENRNSSLKLPLSLLVGYSNVETAVSDINGWMDVTSVVTNFLNPYKRYGNIYRLVDDTNDYANVYSISISNTGSTSGYVNSVELKAGETVSFDAGVLNNWFENKFSLNSTGTEFLITTVTD